MSLSPFHPTLEGIPLPLSESESHHGAAESVKDLLLLMRHLRDPHQGCPWDIEQTFATIAPHTIEEAYEVAEAIEAGDRNSLRDELGDLLLQVVFHSQMAFEEGSFSFQDVCNAVCQKLLRRHPHVFGDSTVTSSAEQTLAWEALKAQERAEKGAENASRVSALDGVSTALPAMTRALKLQNRAARVGFDWDRAADVVGKIEEELAEVVAELNADQPEDAFSGPHANADRLESEIGDLLFSVVNLARKTGLDPERALRRTNRKFDWRFRVVEELLHQQGKSPETASLEEMEALWLQAKQKERTQDDGSNTSDIAVLNPLG